MNLIQEILNILERKEHKKTLELKKDWFEFGRTRKSSVGNPLYTPKMTPHAIRFDDFKCQVISGLVEGTGTEHTLPMWSTVNQNNCNVQTIVDSIFSQDPDATEGLVSGDFRVTGNTVLEGDLLVLGTQTIVESTIVEVADNIMRINSGGAGVDAGIEVIQPSGTKTWAWETAGGVWSTFGESIRTNDIIVGGAIKMDGEILINVVNEAEGLASQDNDQSLATVAAIIDWSDQMDLDIIADSGAPLDILLNAEALHIVGGSNINTDTDGQEKVIINLDGDIVVDSVTSKFLTLQGLPGPYTVESIVNKFADIDDPTSTLVTADAIINYVNEQRDYVQTVALNGTSLDFTGVGNAFAGSVDLSSIAGGGSVPVMSSTVTGTGKLFSDVVQATPANPVTDAADRTYGVQFNNNGQLVVNVPWTVGAGADGNNFVSNVTFDSNTSVLDFTGTGGAFNGSINLAALASTETLTSLQKSGDLLIYTDENGNGNSIDLAEYKNADQNLWANIAVTGQPTITANTLTDTLEFVAGSGIQIQTNATQKKVIISATGGGGTSDGVITDVAFSTTSNLLAFTGSGGGFTGTVDLSSLKVEALTSLAFDGTNLNYIDENGDLSAIPALDFAPVQSVVGDGNAISSSYDTGTGQTMITPIFNNLPSQNSQALVTSGGIWSYIDSLTFPNDFVNNVQLNSSTNTLDFSGTGGAFNGSVSLASYANQNSFETITVDNTGTIPTQNPVVADQVTDSVEFVGGPGIRITSDPASDTLIWSQKIDLVGGLQVNPADEIGLKEVSVTSSTSAQTIADGDTFQVPTVSFDKFGRAQGIDTKTITLNAPGGSGTEACVYGQTVNDLQVLNPTLWTPIGSSQFLGLTNVSGATESYATSFSIEFSSGGSTGFKTYNVKVVAVTQAAGVIDLIEFEDTIYAASDAKITKTFSYSVVNLADQDSVEVQIKGTSDLTIQKATLSVVSSSCEAVAGDKITAPIAR